MRRAASSQYVMSAAEPAPKPYLCATGVQDGKGRIEGSGDSIHFRRSVDRDEDDARLFDGRIDVRREEEILASCAEDDLLEACDDVW